MVGYNRRRQKNNQSRILVSIGLNRLKNILQLCSSGLPDVTKYEIPPYVTKIICKIKTHKNTVRVHFATAIERQ